MFHVLPSGVVMRQIDAYPSTPPSTLSLASSWRRHVSRVVSLVTHVSGMNMSIRLDQAIDL